MSRVKSLAQLLSERVVLVDGAMGTQIFQYKPSVEEYGGAEFDGCVELLNERRPEWIKKIHERYLCAGADCIETNTFGANELVLSEFGLAHRAVEMNVLAARLAREVADSFSTQKYVLGSVGPGTKLLTLQHVEYEVMYKSYLAQMRGLIQGGVDAILIETCQDLAQVKLAVRAARQAMQAEGRQVLLWAQVTIETTGTTLVGSDIQTVLAALEMLRVDVIGMNCATGPDEMESHLAYLSEASPFPVSCIPNAGLPLNQGGETVYPLGPEGFSVKMKGLVQKHGLRVVGGCCGTTPEHIQLMSSWIETVAIHPPKGKYERSVTSLYNPVSLSLEPRPLYVGERTNANGSKKFRDLLGKDDFDGAVGVAREQLKEGAHILDVCVAYVSRDEVRDMDEFLRRLVTQVNIPLMIDSTEVPVIEKALQRAPGKCIVNSINFEDGEERARQVLTLCKEYGASIIALTIDEEGMAKSTERKVAIMERLYKLTVDEFGFAPRDLIIDPLTFTLGSGDEEFRKSAVATLNAITEIKKRYPEVLTILGLSNVSFGLNPWPRQILNSVMLYHAVQCGLDMAILNASKILPLNKIDSEDKVLFEDLIFDNRREGYDPLKGILEKFTDAKAKPKVDAQARAALPIEERLRKDILDGEKQLVVQDALEALSIYSPLQIINDHLLDGMRVVGEKFGAGEMQLPFVLESAEAMKAAVKTLEPYMEKKEGSGKGRMILATVKGDVHDIGKNLVDIILSNNGFKVTNLGIKQPIETIVEEFQKTGADALGMSGLLVKSTVIMKENLEYLETRGYSVPIVLGGAALTRQFVEKDCQAVYSGPVLYAEDAFEGLRIMDALAECRENNQPIDSKLIREKAKKKGNESAPQEKEESSGIRIVRKGERTVPLTPSGQSSWVTHSSPAPTPPFWGTRIIEPTIEEIAAYLDRFALVRSRWGFTQGQTSDEEFTKVLQEKAEPLADEWLDKITRERLVQPKGIYGYFPACSEGNHLVVYAPTTTSLEAPSERRVLHRFELPRQEMGRRLCIADFIKPVESGELDVLAVQIVTMGEEASEFTAKLYADQLFSEYFYAHGLFTELTEASAEFLHKQIRTDLGIVGKDAKNLRQLFSQGYQGSRYSFGYPACPEMESNEPLLHLLEAQRIGVALSESYQMVPELTTSALVIWHPQARYFSL